MYRKSNQYIIYKQAEGDDYVVGHYEMTIGGEIFMIKFDFVPGLSATCSGIRVNPGPPPKFGFEVTGVSSSGHMATATIQVFHR